MEIDNTGKWIISIIAIGCGVVLLLCCLAAILLAGLGIYAEQQFESGITEIPVSMVRTPQPTVGVIRPTSQPTLPAVTPPSNATLESPGLVETPVPTPVVVDSETLKTLIEAEIPGRNLLDLALRLEGRSGISPTVDPRNPPYRVGDDESFWISNSDDNTNFQVTAILRAQTAHANFWIEEGVRFNQSDLDRLAQIFEEQIYPINREFFGSEWTPGVDGDQRLYILFVGGIGSQIAGYFSTMDSFPPALHEYSNAHEMFVMNADNLTLDGEYTYTVLAHEFQHMIHWYNDINEETWLNEGFAELAAVLNGYSLGGADYLYAFDPDIQLNDWPYNGTDSSAHYGSSFLFVSYFLDRFGETATQSLVKEKENGLESVELVLDQIGATDPLTGERISSDEFFRDWLITSFVNDLDVGDGRYAYRNYTSAPYFSETERFDSCPVEPATRAVSQYGVDYILFGCAGEYTLHFEGSVQTTLLPVDPFSGQYAFWSNKGDESDMTLTRWFDFTNVSGPIEFVYQTWYDLEQDFDYLYLLASEDGEYWEIVQTPSGTTYDISGNSYGHAYNGLSGKGSQARWIEETVDLSAYAGKQVWIRFEYVTDAAANGEGFLLDDVSVPAVGYFDDFEQDTGGWEAAGWVRVQNVLPQTFQLSLITRDWSTTEIQHITLQPDLTADIPLSLEIGEEAILVVSGTTRFTRQPAGYQFEIRP